MQPTGEIPFCYLALYGRRTRYNPLTFVKYFLKKQVLALQITGDGLHCRAAETFAAVNERAAHSSSEAIIIALNHCLYCCLINSAIITYNGGHTRWALRNCRYPPPLRDFLYIISRKYFDCILCYSKILIPQISILLPIIKTATW